MKPMIGFKPGKEVMPLFQHYNEDALIILKSEKSAAIFNGCQYNIDVELGTWYLDEHTYAKLVEYKWKCDDLPPRSHPHLIPIPPSTLRSLILSLKNSLEPIISLTLIDRPRRERERMESPGNQKKECEIRKQRSGMIGTELCLRLRSIGQDYCWQPGSSAFMS